VGVTVDLSADAGIREGEDALFWGNEYFLGGDIGDRGINTGIRDRRRAFTTGVEEGIEGDTLGCWAREPETWMLLSLRWE
jgi:hypothetical protein